MAGFRVKRDLEAYQNKFDHDKQMQNWPRMILYEMPNFGSKIIHINYIE